VKIYLVGGAVRDRLRGLTPSDFDYVIIDGDESALRSRIPGLIQVGQGIPVFLRGSDQYTFSEFADIEEDLQSRDLTINALARDEQGELAAHPLALSDLREKILRPIAASNFLQDPLRTVRAARFAAVFPDFTVHEDLPAAMRTVPTQALGAVAAERVGQETLKACAAPRPGNFLRLLSRGKCLLPWFAELAEGDEIPAGPPQWHDSSVLEHIARVMDRCAPDPTAVWMALCHDLGKITTPRAELPRHHGHETRGAALADALALRLRLPNKLRTAGRWAAGRHMTGARYAKLRRSTLIRLLLGLHKAGIVEPFFRMVEADNGGNHLEQAQRELALLTSVTLPEKHRNLGLKSAEILHQMRCEALARHRKNNPPQDSGASGC
jgi:tRNA nucleotidyltransferase (CCA-adding enzyme)